MIFVDASALVAIAAKESDALQLAASLSQALAEEQDIVISPLAEWESVAALCKNYRFSVEAARRVISDLVLSLGFRRVPIGVMETELALDAYARFGRSRHPATLNMGDCFAYACAKANKAKLLFKGDDFTETDIERA